MKRIFSIFFLISCFFTSVLYGQKMTMGFLYPSGGMQGDSLDVVVAGLNIHTAKEVLLSGNGLRARVVGPVEPDEQEVQKGKRKKKVNKSKLTDQSSPQLAQRLRVRVYIAPDAPLGIHDFRFKSGQGVSNKLFFEVSSYPNLVAEYKDLVAGDTTRLPTSPRVLCGQVPPGSINYYRFYAQPGEQFVAHVKARQLLPYIADAVPGWFQPVIRITDLAGKEYAFCDDYGRSPDPTLFFKAEKEGEYLLAIHDAIYRGREDFAYRMTFGQIPFVTDVKPKVVTAGKRCHLTLKGVNLPTTRVRMTPQADVQPFVSFDNGSHAAFLPITVLSEQMKIHQATDRIEPSVTTCYVDSLTEAYQLKEYMVHLEKGQDYVFDIHAARVGSMADLELQIKDESGRVLAVSDDVEDPTAGMITYHADPSLVFECLKTGRYTLQVRELTGAYGDAYFYMLQFPRPQVDFRAFVSPSTLSIPSGGSALLKFEFVGMDRPVAAISLEGLPEGFEHSSCVVPAKAKFLEVTLTAPLGAKEEELSITPTLLLADGSSLEILSVDEMMQAFYYTHRLPAAAFSASVIPASPYRLELMMEDKISLSAIDQELVLGVRVIRDPGFKEPVELMLSKKVKWLSWNPVILGPDEEYKELRIPIVASEFSKFRGQELALHWVATVKGEVQKQGKRTFENAAYREISPLFVVRKETVQKRSSKRKKASIKSTKRKKNAVLIP